MDIATAEMVFAAIATPLFIIWAMGAVYAIRVSTETDHTIQGELKVKGEAEALSKAIGTGLLTPGIMGGQSLSAIKIVERTSELVTFEREGMGNGRVPFDSGVIKIEQQGDTCRVRYGISTAKTMRALKLTSYIVALGVCGLVVAGVGIGVWFGIVTNTSLSDQNRLQTYQTFQMIHGAWPPYLIGFIGSRLTRGVKIYFDTLISNTEFTV